MAKHRPDRILVTGAGGFVGRHVLRFLAEVENAPGQIIAVDRFVPQWTRPGSIWTTCDLTDRQQVASTLSSHMPDAILHLAAVMGGEDLQACFSVNVQAAEILLSEAAKMTSMPRIVMVGSAAQYGSASPGLTIVGEDHPLKAETPYGVSKTLQEKWAMLYWATRSLPIICARPFNLLGPGQSTNMVPGAFMAQIQQVMKGQIPHVKVGNLSSQRDFVDVRDVASAFWALLTTDENAYGQAYNIASGVATGIQELLDACLEIAGGRIEVQQDADRMNKVDVSTMIGSPSKLHAQTGWQSTIPWRMSLADMWQNLQSQESGHS